jgi:hypothetical protein
MRKGGAGLHTLVGAYVMDAVPEADRVAFERHLGGCEQCREEVRGLREATARLATAAAIEPRPGLREDTLLAASRLRQLPPVVPTEPGAGRAGPLKRWRARSLRASSVRQSWLTTATAAAVAFAILFGGAAIGLGLHLTSMQHRLTAAERRDRAIAAVLGAPDARTMTAQAKTGGTATVVMSPQARALVFTADRLPGLPASKAYELWVMGPAGATAAGMLPPAHGGMSGPMVVSHLAPGDQLGLTVEPAAGSRQPTSIPLVLVGLGA